MKSCNFGINEMKDGERDRKFIKRISLSNNKLDKFLERDRRWEIRIEY